MDKQQEKCGRCKLMILSGEDVERCRVVSHSDGHEDSAGPWEPFHDPDTCATRLIAELEALQRERDGLAAALTRRLGEIRSSVSCGNPRCGQCWGCGAEDELRAMDSGSSAALEKRVADSERLVYLQSISLLCNNDHYLIRLDVPKGVEGFTETIDALRSSTGSEQKESQ